MLYRKLVKKNCANCGKEITRFQCQMKSNNVFCNYTCYWKHKSQKTKRVCLHCEKIFLASPSEIKRGAIFCSNKCRRRYCFENKQTKKEICDRYILNHPEKVIKSKYRYHSNKYFGGLRDDVLERDNFQCQLCNSKEKIHIHHKDKNKNNNNLLNLITLCASCHAVLHHKKNLQGGDALWKSLKSY